MNHTLQAEGFGVRLRPVRLDDAPFIVWLRHLDRALGRIGDSAADVNTQIEWLKDYFDRAGDYYFMIETMGGVPAGTIGIYNKVGNSAEVGRIVVRPDAVVALAGNMLLLDLAYGSLGLMELHGTVVASNRPMRNFVRNYGFQEKKAETKTQMIGGVAVDLVYYHQHSEDWAKAREQLLELAFKTEAKLREWEAREIRGTAPTSWRFKS